MFARQLLTVVFALCFCLVGRPNPIHAQVKSELPQESESIQRIVKDLLSKYEDQLNATLKTRFEAEKNYVEQVVELIRQNRLPKKLVDSAWIWVRQNRPYTRYPFVYFERILRLQAEKLELEIPDFDRENYYSRFREAAVRARQRR